MEMVVLPFVWWLVPDRGTEPAVNRTEFSGGSTHRSVNTPSARNRPTAQTKDTKPGFEPVRPALTKGGRSYKLALAVLL